MTSELPLVLVVEDEPKMRRLLRVTLESNGMRYAEAVTAREALSKAQGQTPDVVIVDLGLPDADGIDVIRGLRRWSAIPAIVLSARAQESAKVAALDAGADDYVTKPFATGELLARIRVALRHSTAQINGETQAVFNVRDLRVDLLQRKVTLRGGYASHPDRISTADDPDQTSRPGRHPCGTLERCLGSGKGGPTALLEDLHGWTSTQARGRSRAACVPDDGNRCRISVDR
jgi:CheY-like chemotaxis protein